MVIRYSHGMAPHGPQMAPNGSESGARLTPMAALSARVGGGEARALKFAFPSKNLTSSLTRDAPTHLSTLRRRKH